jgi:hypothetical protein
VLQARPIQRRDGVESCSHAHLCQRTEHK